MAATEFYPSLGRCVAWPSSCTRLPHHTGAETAQSPHGPPAEAALPACLSRCLKSRQCQQDRSIISSRQVWVPLSLCTQSALSGLLGVSTQNTCPCLLLSWYISHLCYVALEHQKLVNDIVVGLSTSHASCELGFPCHSSLRPFFPVQLT